MPSQYAGDISEIKVMLKEVRDDVRRINGSVISMVMWRDEHEKRHARSESAGQTWTSRVWNIFASYIPIAIALVGWAILKQAKILP